MPPEVLNLLVQLPIVAVFIWYSDRMNKQFQEFLKSQREDDRIVIRSLVTQIECMDQRLENHDVTTTEAIAVMKERTKNRRAESRQ
jgi:hypothetical protein